MVRLILGRAGAGKTGLVFREIGEYVAQGRKNLVLLVPEQYSHEAERELCAAAGDKLSRYGEVLSFTGLARRVFSQCCGPIGWAGESPGCWTAWPTGWRS